MTAVSDPVSPGKETSSSGPGKTTDRWRALGYRYGTLVGFLLMVVIFSLVQPDTFASVYNARNILEQAAPILLVAVGFTVAAATNEFDLSFVGLVSLCSVVSAKALTEWGLGAAVAVLVAIALGGALGLVAGALVAMKRASSLIVTLALSTVWAGIALGLSKGGQTISISSEPFLNLTFKRPLGVPLAVVYSVIVVAVAIVLVKNTTFGRSIRAIGSNEGASRLAGLGVGRTRMGAFAFAGVCYGLAAVVLTSRAGQSSPDLSAGLLVPPFVAVFFGQSVLAAGRFNVIGTVVGALFIGTLETGLTIIGSSAWVTEVITGGVLVVTLLVTSQKAQTR